MVRLTHCAKVSQLSRFTSWSTCIFRLLRFSIPKITSLIRETSIEDDLPSSSVTVRISFHGVFMVVHELISAQLNVRKTLQCGVLSSFHDAIVSSHIKSWLFCISMVFHQNMFTEFWFAVISVALFTIEILILIEEDFQSSSVTMRVRVQF